MEKHFMIPGNAMVATKHLKVIKKKKQNVAKVVVITFAGIVFDL